MQRIFAYTLFLPCWGHVFLCLSLCKHKLCTTGLDNLTNGCFCDCHHLISAFKMNFKSQRGGGKIRSGNLPRRRGKRRRRCCSVVGCSVKKPKKKTKMSSNGNRIFKKSLQNRLFHCNYQQVTRFFLFLMSDACLLFGCVCVFYSPFRALKP